MLTRQRATCGSGEFVTVVASGFVSVMSIGNEQRFVLQYTRHFADHTLIANRPKAVSHIQMVHRFECRLVSNVGFQDILRSVVGVRIQSVDLTHVRVASACQTQPVIFRFAVSFFVRVNISLPKPHKLNA